MKEAVSKENQITHGVIWKQLLVFFFPILLGTFFQQIYNTADTVVVGRFVGTQALAAVGGSTSQIINLIVGFFTGLASGATVVISQHYGAKDQEGVQRGLRTAYAFSIVGGVIHPADPAPAGAAQHAGGYHRYVGDLPVHLFCGAYLCLYL